MGEVTFFHVVERGEPDIPNTVWGGGGGHKFSHVEETPTPTPTSPHTQVIHDAPYIKTSDSSYYNWNEAPTV